MAHCVLWQASDWAFAWMTLEIAALVHGGEVKLAAELRHRERVLGTTCEMLRGKRIRYVEPPADNDERRIVGSGADFRSL